MAAQFDAWLPNEASTLGRALSVAALATPSTSGEVHAYSVPKRLRNLHACAVCSKAKVSEVRGEWGLHNIDEEGRVDGRVGKVRVAPMICCARGGAYLFPSLTHTPSDIHAPDLVDINIRKKFRTSKALDKHH